MKGINELLCIDKPRNKLQDKGVCALKNYELLAILLGSGTKGKDVIKLSKEIANIFEQDFEHINLENLTSIHGLGNAKASQILSAIELSRRFLIKQNKQIKNAVDIYNELHKYTNKKQEYFLAISLDGANHIIKKRVISMGTISQTLVHPREVFSPSIQDRAASVIVAHNHPSGVLKPSNEDIDITKRLNESSKILGIELLDHLIISKNGYFSFKENGLFD